MMQPPPRHQAIFPKRRRRGRLLGWLALSLGLPMVTVDAVEMNQCRASNDKVIWRNAPCKPTESVVSSQVLANGGAEACHGYVLCNASVLPLYNQAHPRSYSLKALINAAVVTDFVIDTGATGIQINQTTFEQLKQKGAIDPKPEGKSETIIADGSKHKVPWVTLRSLQVGRIVIHNIQATVQPKADNVQLLGMSFLQRINWRLDPKTKTFTIE